MSTELTIIALCGMVLFAFGSLTWLNVRQQRQFEQFVDEYQRALDGALDNLEHVTAERDKLRAERDALRRELANMTGEL